MADAGGGCSLGDCDYKFSAPSVEVLTLLAAQFLEFTDEFVKLLSHKPDWVIVEMLFPVIA